ncbi:MAG: cysteine desulfurase family protein, partial [Patescibacteria group bacterium]
MLLIKVINELLRLVIMRNKIIYLDNAASTPIDKKVASEMAQAAKLYGNPSSYNDCGREAREYIERSRLKVARFLGAHSDEIIFTSSGTESNNLAIRGIAANFKNQKSHIITTQIEHPSVLRSVERLEKEGFDVSYLSVNKEGFVNRDELQKTLRPETVLVSVMYANNEIGTIEPIAKIREVMKKSSIRSLFHIDACQATEYLDMNVNHLGADLLTFNGSKIYGPRGIGVLYVRRGTNISPIVLGGEQEFGLRAGTENLPAIGGLAVALENIDKKDGERLSKLQDYFLKVIAELIPEVKINGASGKDRLPNNISVSIPGADSENLLLELDKHGICAGSGSACASHAVEPSHVLKAIGLEEKYLN